MSEIERLDASRRPIATSRHLRMPRTANRRRRLRVNGLYVGVADMTRDPPHADEVHPDGAELIYILSGRVTVAARSSQRDPLELRSDDACIIPKGEWYRVHLLEPTRLLPITPGPNGGHPPLRAARPAR
jgi:mannose-6-phosphate isomerase-like protein (cupin superfamily)